MKALAEQIAELDGVETYGRVVGVRGLLVEVAGPIHAMSVGARVMIEAGGGGAGSLRGGCVRAPQHTADALRAAGRRATRLPSAGYVCCGCGASVAGVARPRRQRDGRTDRRQGPAAGRAAPLSLP